MMFMFLKNCLKNNNKYEFMHNADFEVTLGTFPGNVVVRKRNYAAGFRFVYCAGLSFS